MLSRIIGFMPRLGRPRAVHLLLACGLGIGLLLAAGSTWDIVATRQNAIDDATREMRNDALMLAEDEDRLLQMANHMQLRLIDHMRDRGIDSPEQFEQVMTSRAAYQQIRDQIAELGYISALMLSDRNGILLNFTRGWPAPPINASDTDFIRELSRPDAPQMMISQPARGKLTGEWTIYLSRRFEATDGRLIGFVTSSIQLRYFEQFYARLPLTGDGAFSLFRRDGVLLARYPRADSTIGSTFGDDRYFGQLIAALNGGVMHQRSHFDDRDRLMVPHEMAHFPLIISVSDSTDSILRRWRPAARMLVATVSLLELLIIGTILLAARHLRGQDQLRAAEAARARAEADLGVAEERERAAQTMRSQEQRFDTALQNMVQGLLMIDRDGNVLAANRRFHELWGLPSDSITPGMRYAEATRLVTTLGNIEAEDMDEIRRRRHELNQRKTPARFLWEVSDGRAFNVTHQPMDDGWLTTYEDITEQRAAQERIAHLAHHDALTGLANRARLREKLDATLAFARRGYPLALHCLDLDQFKAVNDTLGHPIGDHLLRAVAQRLRDALRETDTVARLGGDEFAIVQTTIGSPVDATELADRLIELMEAPFEIEGHQIVIGTSIGIAYAPQDGVDADQLLKCADLALYRAKSEGRGVYRLFQAEMDAAMQARRVLELDLRQAAQLGQLELFFQPQVDVRDRRVAGCEALLRWRHPTMGLVSPARFIPLAEETGMIVPIGKWVLRQACIAATGWPKEVKVAVNLSAVQFKTRDLVDTVVAALHESGLDPRRLELEITESVMLKDTDTTMATLHQLRSLGIQIAMDDFGTGYSSLSYLRRFPFDRIKIDQSFVRELGKRDDCIAIVRAVIALGRDLGMSITAEGVETRQQLDTLERAGCTEIQGYLFSKAVPESAVPDLLRSIQIAANAWPDAGPRLVSGTAETREYLAALSA